MSSFTDFLPVAGIGGSGTANYIPKFIDTNTIGNSAIYESSGNIGIGTSSPSSMLTLNGDEPYIRLEKTGVPTWEIRQNFPNTEYGFSVVNVTAGTTPLFIGNSGNVGIGTSSPDQLLHIFNSSGDANLLIDSTSTGGDARLMLKANSSGVSQIRFEDEADANVGLLTYNHSDNSMQFRTSDAERMRIASSGNVGIGLSNATEKLDIYQVNTGTDAAIRIRANRFYNTSANVYTKYQINSSAVNNGTVYKWETGMEGDAGGQNFVFKSTSSNGTVERMTITRAGAVFMPYLVGSSGYNDLAYNTANGQLIYRTSSLRYKENVQDLPSALDKVNNLRTVTYDEKETGRSYFGLIAEELYEHIPELVTMKEIEGFDEPQPDGITYSMLSVYLLKAMQEQQEIINDLKARIETLENK